MSNLQAREEYKDLLWYEVFIDLHKSPRLYFFILKGLVAGCHSFCLFFIFYNIHSFNPIHSIHLSVAIRQSLSPSYRF
jgi:hypothetical protein